jgi:hypothetical protein
MPRAFWVGKNALTDAAIKVQKMRILFFSKKYDRIFCSVKN